MSLPEFNDAGDLPVGVHKATLSEALAHFGTGGSQRVRLAQRLSRVHELAQSTGKVARFIVFGSFVTKKDSPGDIDIFMIMDDDFDVSAMHGEARVTFDHMAADTYEGASVFWLRRMAAFGGEDAAIADWQIKRDGNRRGIVEVISDDNE